MQYGQIVFILFVAMACYYAFLIFTDIRKAQAARNAEQENHTEEEIDISDEARNFHPTKVSRDEEKKEEAASEKQEETPPDADSTFRRPGYREAVMTDGILVDDLIHKSTGWRKAAPATSAWSYTPARTQGEQIHVPLATPVPSAMKQLFNELKKCRN